MGLRRRILYPPREEADLHLTRAPIHIMKDS